MIKVNELEIEHHGIEWGVEYLATVAWDADGFAPYETKTLALDSEEEARRYAGLMDGKVVCREVFETAWAVAPE